MKQTGFFNRTRLFHWHSWLGLVTGLFLVLIGFSGAIAVFKHEIDWLVTPALRVAPHGTEAPVDAVMESLRRHYPGGDVRSFGFREGPRSAHTAFVRDSSGRTYQVHVDPYTAEVRGQRATGGYTWSLQNFIRQFHVRLLMGFWGRVFVGAFGVTLFLSCVFGLIIYRNWLRFLFTLRWNRGWRLMSSDLHKAIGLWSLLFNLLIAASGAVLGLENLYGKIRYDWLDQPRENLFSRTLDAPLASGDSVLSTTRAMEIAQARFPDMKPTSVYFPSRPDRMLIVTGDVSGALVAKGSTRVGLHPHTGVVLVDKHARKVSFGDRLYNMLDPLHFGYFGGLAVKVIWFLLGLTPGSLALSGFWIWFLRLRQRSRTRTARALKTSPAATNSQTPHTRS